MNIQKMLLTIVALAVLLIGAIASAQMNDQAAREEARHAIRSQLHLSPKQFLSAHRDESLEQLLALAFGKQIESKLIYRVSQAGEEVKGNAIVHHISTDADLMYIIAVDLAGESTYCIHGFSDSFNEFDKLIKAEDAKVSSPERAEFIADFYRAVNPENMPTSPISSLLDMKQAAERQCHSGAKSFDIGQEAFTAWWNHAKPLYSAILFQQTTTARGDGYRVKWVVLSSSSGENCGGTPLRATLDVGSDGQVSKVRLTRLQERSKPTSATH